MRRLTVGIAALALSVLSCGREPTAPGASGGVVRSQALAFVAEFPSGLPVFQAAGGSGVAFVKVHVVLTNPDGSVALDRWVEFPAGQSEVQVTLDVPLPADAPSGGVPLALTLDYVNADGVVVFHGGPATVIAVPRRSDGSVPPPSSVTVPISYTGPGANAARVEITPAAQTVNTGAAFTFTARAFDALNNVLANTPVVFTSQNAALATINASTGAGTAGAARGSVAIVAQLLTGQSATATLTIVSPPAAIAAVSGGGQSGPTGTALAQPIVAKVTAADGLPAQGVTVAFAAQNGGTTGAASVVTGADGLAQTTWTLGPGVGAQTMTATAAGLTGSPVTFTATAVPTDPVRLAIATQPPATVPAMTAFGLVVTAIDAKGAATTGFMNNVTIELGPDAPSGAALTGTTTVAAAGGTATFTDLHLNVAGTYTLVASAASLQGATTQSFQVIAGDAHRLSFGAYPTGGARAGASLAAVTVLVRDDGGNVVTSYTGPVTIAANGPSAIVAAAIGPEAAARADSVAAAANVLGGTTTVNAAAGVATFTGLTLTTAGSYTLTATAAGMGATTGTAFTIRPGPAATLALLLGGGQSGPAGVPFPTPVLVRVSDAFGNPIAGAALSFTPDTGAGVANPANALTTANGTASTTWTPAGSPGQKTLRVKPTVLAINQLAVTGTVAGQPQSGILRTWTGATSDDWNTASNWNPPGVPAAQDSATIPYGTPNTPTISAPVTIANLVVAPYGALRAAQAPANVYFDGNPGLVNNSTLTVGGSIDADGGIDGPGSVTANGAAGILCGTFAGPVTVKNGAYVLDCYVEVGGSLTVSANGVLDIAGNSLDVDADFATTTGGKLKSTTNGDGAGVWVEGNAAFGGGSTAGLLTIGLLNVEGNFTEGGGAPDAFAPGPAFVTQLESCDCGLRAPPGVRAPVLDRTLTSRVRAAADAASVRSTRLGALPRRMADRHPLLARPPLTPAQAARRAAAQATRQTAASRRSAARAEIEAKDESRLSAFRARRAAVNERRAAHARRPARGSAARSANQVVGPGPNLVTFQHPTTSFFGTLGVYNDITLGSDVLVGGTLAAFYATASSTNGRAITTHGAQIIYVTFSNVRLTIIDDGGETPAASLSNVTMGGMDPTVDQLTLKGDGNRSGVYTLEGWIFETIPTTGHFVKAAPASPSASPFEIDFTGSSVEDAEHETSYAVDAVMSVPVAGFAWPGTRTWSGAVAVGEDGDGNWGTPANWQQQNVPLPFDDVVIPGGTPGTGYVSNDLTINNLTIGTGTSFDTACFELMVFGNVVAPLDASAVRSCDGEGLGLAGGTAAQRRTVTGRFDVLDVTGYYNVVGSVIAEQSIEINNGNFRLNGGSVYVGGPSATNGYGWGEFATYGNGTFTMDNNADGLFIGNGGARFEGGSTNGLLTAGTITLVGTESCISGLTAYDDAFAPGGTHTVVFDGESTHWVYLSNPGASFLQNAYLNTGFQIELESDVTVKGTLGSSPSATGWIGAYESAFTLTTSGLNFGGPGSSLTISNVAIRFVDGTANATFNNVSWTWGFAFGGDVLTVNRSAPSVFDGHDFTNVPLASGGHWVNNTGAGAVSMTNATPGTASGKLAGNVSWSGVP